MYHAHLPQLLSDTIYGVWPLPLTHQRYRLKPYGGGMRTKVVKLEGWMQLMNDAHLIDSQFTTQVR